jgi:hypothetical protein
VTLKWQCIRCGSERDMLVVEEAPEFGDGCYVLRCAKCLALADLRHVLGRSFHMKPIPVERAN